MAIPTDRGLVVVDVDAEGIHTVSVCAQVVNGQPVDTFASHFTPFPVQIHPDVPVVTRGTSRYTRAIAEVFLDESGTLHVRRPKRR